MKFETQKKSIHQLKLYSKQSVLAVEEEFSEGSNSDSVNEADVLVVWDSKGLTYRLWKEEVQHPGKKKVSWMWFWRACLQISRVPGTRKEMPKV